MRIIVAGAPELVPALAARLRLDPVDRVSIDIPDGFVLDGTGLSVVGMRALDTVLRTRAAEVDAVLWCGEGDASLLEHYHGRVVDVRGEKDAFGAALDGLREVLRAS